MILQLRLRRHHKLVREVIVAGEWDCDTILGTTVPYKATKTQFHYYQPLETVSDKPRVGEGKGNVCSQSPFYVLCLVIIKLPR